MTMTMYSATVPALTRMLTNLSAILSKAEAHAAARKIDLTCCCSRGSFLTRSPGFPFASLMRSATERTDSAGCQTRTFGEAASLLTDAKSRSVSYGSFVLRLGFTAVLVDVMSSV